MDRETRNLLHGKQPRVKELNTPPQKRQGETGDMCIFQNDLYVRTKNQWLKLMSGDRVVNQEVTKNISTIISEGAITHSGLNGIGINDHHNKQHGLNSDTDHTGTLDIDRGGTGQTTAAAAANALLNTSQGGSLSIGDGSDTITVPGDLVVSGSSALSMDTTATGSVNVKLDATDALVVEQADGDDVLVVDTQNLAVTVANGLYVGTYNANNLIDDAAHGSTTTRLYIGGKYIVVDSDIGSAVQAYDAGLANLASFNTRGFVSSSSNDAWVGRTITGTANKITVTNGDGVSGNPTITLPDDLDLGAGTSITAGTIYTDTIKHSNEGANPAIAFSAGSSIDITLGTDGGDDFKINSTHLVVEGDTGKVGIGVATPDQMLHIKGTAPQILLHESSYEFVRMGVLPATHDMCLGWDDNDDMHFGVFGSRTDTTIDTKMIIQSDGAVGIGTTGPSEELHIYKTTSAAVSAKIETNQDQEASLKLKNSQGEWEIKADDGADAFRIADVGTASLFTILAGGNVGIGTGTPGNTLEVKSATGSSSYIRVNTTDSNDSTSDAGILLAEAGTNKWNLFNDGSDSDKLKLNDKDGDTWITVVQDSGNVGIGTTTPSGTLDVVAAPAQISIVRDDATITNNEVLGHLYFGGTEDAGATIDHGALITARAANNTGGWASGSKHGSDLEFYTAPIDGTVETKMIIEANGNIAMGRGVAPAFSSGGGVEIQRAGVTTLRLENSTNSKITELVQSATSFDIDLRNTQGLAIQFVGSDKVVVDTNGDVGIGVSDPDAKLEVFSGGTQLKLSYDATHNSTLSTNGSGDLTIDTSGNDIFMGADSNIGSADYNSQTTGWRITDPGDADFRYLYADELHVKAFIADLEQALAGGQIVSKSVAIVAEDFTMCGNGATVNFKVHDLPSADNMAVFEDGDYVRFRTFSRASGSLTISDAWGTVTSYSDLSGGDEGLQQWTFERAPSGSGGAMSDSTTVVADSLVLDYGTPGMGYYEVNAIDGKYGANSPYAQIVTWDNTNLLNDATSTMQTGSWENAWNDTGAGAASTTSYDATTYWKASYGQSIKVNITNDGSSHVHIQLKQKASVSPFFELTSGTRYYLKFVAKASSGRTIKVKILESESDWTVYGLDESVVLTTDWKEFEYYFDANTTTTGGHANATVDFFLGDSGTGDVWIGECFLYEAKGPGASGALTTKARFGHLAGLSVGEKDEYGLYAGPSSTNYLKASNLGLKLYADADTFTSYTGSAIEFHDTGKKMDLTAGKIKMYNGSDVVSEWDASTIYLGDQDTEHLKITTSSLEIKDSSTVLASYGATTTIGNTSSEHVSISSSGVAIKDGGTTHATYASDTTITGGNVTIKQTANPSDDYIILDSTSFKVFKGGNAVSQFGEVVKIGRVADDHSRLEVDASGNLRIYNRQGSTDTASIELLNGGTANFAGNITAAGGTIAGWGIDTTKIHKESGNTKMIFSTNASEISGGSYASNLPALHILDTDSDFLLSMGVTTWDNGGGGVNSGLVIFSDYNTGPKKIFEATCTRGGAGGSVRASIANWKFNNELIWQDFGGTNAPRKLYIKAKTDEEGFDLYINNQDSGDNGVAVGEVKTVTMGRLRTAANIASGSDVFGSGDYGFQIIKRTGTSGSDAYKDIMYVGQSKAEIAGWEFDQWRFKRYTNAAGSSAAYNFDINTPTTDTYSSTEFMTPTIRTWKADGTHMVTFGQHYYKSDIQNGFGFSYTSDYNNGSHEPEILLGTTNKIAGWTFTNAQFASTNRNGGSNAVLTTAGIVLDSSGWISASKFWIAQNGNAYFDGTLGVTSLAATAAHIKTANIENIQLAGRIRTGTIAADGSTISTGNNILLGDDIAENNNGEIGMGANFDKNVFVGLDIWKNTLTTGVDTGKTVEKNVCIGFQAMEDINPLYSSGGSCIGNIAIGYNAAKDRVYGESNISIGTQSGGASGVATGDHNVAIGRECLENLTSGDQNICIGYKAGENLSGGHRNVFIGTGAGINHASNKSNNIAIGEWAGWGNSNMGGGCVYIGQNIQGTSGAGFEIIIGGTSGTGSSESGGLVGRGTNTVLIGCKPVAGGPVYNILDTTAWDQYSDRRIKKNIRDYPDSLDKINSIKVRQFNYKDDSEDMPIDESTGKTLKMGKDSSILRTGVIAQEIESIFPDCVDVTSQGILSVNASEINWALLKAVQELSAKVTELEKKIN